MTHAGLGFHRQALFTALLFAGFGFCGLCLRADDPAPDGDAEGEYPRLSVGEVTAAFVEQAGGLEQKEEGPGVAVPVSLSRAGESNYMEVSIFYDDRLLTYGGVREGSAEWKISGVTGFREQSEGHLRGVLLRDETAAPGDASPEGELTVLQLLFTLEDRLADDPDLLFEFTPISFTPLAFNRPGVGSSSSYVGYLHGDENDSSPQWQPTELSPGGVGIYYQSFVEVGSGEMTRREQTFVVPLLLTYLGDIDAVSVGVDYDELILREVRPIVPPVLHDDVPITNEGKGSSSFEFEFGPPGSSGEGDGEFFLRAHIADLVFYYDGEAGSDLGALRIVPSLLGVRGEGEGGAIHPQAVGGTITFTGSYFVRGNVDSSTSRNQQTHQLIYTPDISDAVLLLTRLFLDRTRTLPCAEAADVDDSGLLDVTDVLVLLHYLFRGSETPADPFPEPGLDNPRSPEDLGCDHPLPYFRSSGTY